MNKIKGGLTVVGVITLLIYYCKVKYCNSKTIG